MSTSPQAAPPPESKSPPPPPSNSSSSRPPSSSPPPPPSGNSTVPSPPPLPSNNNTSSTPPLPNKASPSPPPPHSSKSSPTLSPPNGTNSSNSSKTSTNQAVILGAVIGFAIVLVAMVIIFVVCLVMRKKHHKSGSYFGDASRKGNSSNHYKYKNGHHAVRTQGGGQGGMPANGGWGGGTSSPPKMVSSGEMSSDFSGRALRPPPPPNFGFSKGTFTYDELAAATRGFSQANVLGQGGFGYVYKGVLPTGKEIAVKSLKSGSGQGEREFQAEVEIISRVHHRHLVSLVGYCNAGGQRMLVYEFVPNETLEHHLHGNGLPTMDWPTRLRIAIGSAKGLAYLHEDCHPRIIHRDIKSANILLDFNFEAKVADFGLAKLTSDNYTHVSTRVMGTFGYLAPEYASSGKLTEKSDVFSFGVMLLEILSGKRPVDPNSAMEDSLVDWARPLLSRALDDGNFGELVDPSLENNYNYQEMRRMAACAAASILHSAKKRPKMSQIVRALEGDVSLDDLNEGVRPGQSAYFGNVVGSADYDANAYHSDLTKFRKMALSSQDFGSSGTSHSDSHEIGLPESQREHF